ncbi:ATP-dependent DNA helicase pif1-like [Octopus vulgaris]|uniref:ATP-dependent DNA helicase pif1-like n=1 Tax=Octopus vulgaris TaxID=6645 RepID=A0AA36BPB0_OCTVU|nr:ATP-dependent DNA helicase pif1-like [Octopus vulgaris]
MLLKISNGQITFDDNKYINTTTIGHTFSRPDDLSSAIYPNLTMEYIKPDSFCDRAVLAPTNAAVNTVNYDLLSQLPSQELCYRSLDTIIELDQVTQFLTEFLYSKDPPGLPPHELHLNVSYHVILLCNPNVPTLCNGTRLVVKQMMDHVTEA